MITAEFPADFVKDADIGKSEPPVERKGGLVRQDDAGESPVHVLIRKSPKQCGVERGPDASPEELRINVNGRLHRRLVGGLVLVPHRRGIAGEHAGDFGDEGLTPARFGELGKPAAPFVDGECRHVKIDDRSLGETPV